MNVDTFFTWMVRVSRSMAPISRGARSRFVGRRVGAAGAYDCPESLLNDSAQRSGGVVDENVGGVGSYGWLGGKREGKIERPEV